MDTRHKKRIATVQNLFSFSFSTDSKVPHPKDELSRKIIARANVLDKKITAYIDKFTIEKLARVDLAILRLAVYELTVEKKTPPKVVINEAVELAKELGGERSYSFINGILGKIYKNVADNANY